MLSVYCTTPLQRSHSIKLLYPVISPRLVGPSDPKEKSEEYRTFLDSLKVAHSTEFSELEVARSTVKRIREVQRSDYKQWRALRTKSGANKGGDSESNENLASYLPAQNSWLKVIVFIASASGYVLGRTESKRGS